MLFQQDWPKDKKLQLFQFFASKLRKIRSIELNGAALEGSTFFFIAAPHAVRQWKAID